MHAQDVRTLSREEGASDATWTWYSELQQRVHDALATRQSKIASLRTQGEIEAYQRAHREFMWHALGGKPPQGAIHAQTVGTLPGDRFTIEKVIFESQPRHHVTANVYVPHGTGPFPAVVVSSGHSRTAKAAEYNQRFGVLLAQHGILACCFDPIGQGERSQIVDNQWRPMYPGTTTEHLLMGTGSILVGRNTATYRVWDAMRVVDYLVSRKDVNPSKIGMTGCSGGGTLTSYVMALDDRIACASPSCYITSFDSLIDSIGPQDAEQNVFGQLAQGLDQADYVLLRAPAATLISATSEDFFPIAGTWQAFREAKRIFTRLGAPERVEMVEADGKHGVQPENLAAIVGWMQRWLNNKDEPVDVPVFATIPMRSVEELQCTPQGQVLGLPDEKSVFDLNAEVALAHQSKRDSEWKKRSFEEKQNLVRQTLNLKPENESVKLNAIVVRTIESDLYTIHKFVLKSDSVLPVLLYKPKKPNGDIYLYLSDEGIGTQTELTGPLASRLQQGATLVLCDLRGQGATMRRNPGIGKPDPLLGDWQTASLAYLLGTSVIAAHTQDILQITRWLAEEPDMGRQPIRLVAQGATGIAACHAAFLEPKRFRNLTLEETPPDWTEVVGNPNHGRWIGATVHGALLHYDLKMLRESLTGLIDVRLQ